MEHIKQFDWCSSEPDVYFLKERDLDNCVTERILRNKFHDPLVTSDSDDEGREKIDWGQVFKRHYKEDGPQRCVVAGLRAVPPYPRVSALSRAQHVKGLKVLSAAHPDVLPSTFLHGPTKQDYRAVQDYQPAYEIEQREFKEWAKALWINTQCVRALRPKPMLEAVYDAEFTMQAAEMQSFPKHYELAAQISYESRNKCKIVHIKDLVNIKVSELPEVHWPDLEAAKVSVLCPRPMPEPCSKHPTRLVLPNEKCRSILPLTEGHLQLAQYGLDHGAQYVVSEDALRCLVRAHDEWALPVTVGAAIGAEGQSNVLVVGSAFPARRPYARKRIYRALRHLLEHALVPASERAKVLQRREKGVETDNKGSSGKRQGATDAMDVASDDEEQLVIDDTRRSEAESDEEQSLQIDLDTDCDTPKQKLTSPRASRCNSQDGDDNGTDNSTTKDTGKLFDKVTGKRVATKQAVVKKKKSVDDFYDCTCKDPVFAAPPPRSFRKWQVRNAGTGKHLDIIVHCSHKGRSSGGEVVLEPHPEYQIDLAGSRQPADTLRALALALHLRRNNAAAITARVDATSGELVTLERLPPAALAAHGDLVGEASGTVHAALDQLTGLVPGHYVLVHEPSHGTNALLYAATAAADAATLTLGFDRAQLPDEAAGARVPPDLVPVLLPVHKHRRILPCAFTPYENQVRKEKKQPPAKQKTPPQAIKWPKRKGSRKKKTASRE